MVRTGQLPLHGLEALLPADLEHLGERKASPYIYFLWLFNIYIYISNHQPVSIYIYICTLWLFNIAMVFSMAPIEIDGLPIKNDDFPWLC